jgi:2-phospho-L-lactate guanylyltransferase
VIWALLPVKDLVRAKSRLAGVLAPHERRALAQAMAEDVLTALTGSGLLAGVLMVSDDPGAELLAHRYGVDLVEETSLGCHGLNPVIAAGCARLVDKGASGIMVVHSDLPLLTSADLKALNAVFEQGDVDRVLSPDRARGGTNIFLFDSARLPAFQYGPGSCEAHSRATRAEGLRLRIEARARVALDIDEPEDLLELLTRLESSQEAGHTAGLLLAPALRRRLALIAQQGIDDGRGTGT